MHDHPSSKEIIEAVKQFIDTSAAPQLKGHAAFHARVASNALSIVLREMSARAENETDERHRLAKLLNREGSISELNDELCAKIRSGELTTNSAGLVEHLKRTTIDQLKIDQPKYSGLKTALENL